MVYMHRWLLSAKSLPRTRVVDFIDGNRRDCRRTNLRVCSKAQQLANTVIDHLNTSGYKGVSRLSAGRFTAALRIEGSTRWLGTFATAAEAARAYDAASREVYGSYSRYNFPRRGERSALPAPPSKVALLASAELRARWRG
jgi:hypothetical protein